MHSWQAQGLQGRLPENGGGVRRSMSSIAAHIILQDNSNMDYQFRKIYIRDIRSSWRGMHLCQIRW